MMADETPPFLLLKLFSTDDNDGAIATWRGRIGGHKSLLATLTMAYHVNVAALKMGAPVVMDVHGQPRRFAVLSIGPALDAVCTEMRIWELPTEAEAQADEAPAYSHALEFEATGSMAKNIEQLHQEFQVRCCAHEVLHGTNSDVRFIPN